MNGASPRHLVFIAAILISITEPVLAKEKIVAYVPNWVDLKSFSETIDYAKITHINIAFENPINDRGDLSFHQKDEILITKAHANNVKILVSIGGGSASGNKALQARYFDLLSAPKRPALPRSSPRTSRITGSMVWTLISKGRRSTRITARSSASCRPQ